MTDGQKLTKQSYEDEKVVSGYIQKNAINPARIDLLDKFEEYIKGKKILDLGCGPGQYSYLFADKGFAVTGLDYSKEMIKQAKLLKESNNQPTFMIGDMRKLHEYFTPDYFDAVWAAASLLHIREKDIDLVLSGISEVTKKDSPILITLKQGDSVEIVKEHHLDVEVVREYTLWAKDEFIKRAEKHGLELVDFSDRQGRIFLGKPTAWMQMIFKLRK